MPRPEPGEPSSGSEDEYEVEYLYGAKWTETGWDYEVHWYGYDTRYDTWEPEANLTDYGSADLVNRFWKEFPKKRFSHPIVGTKYTAPPEWLVAERKRFLARRQRDQPVKGRETPPRKSVKAPIPLQGDPESGSDSDDEDVLRPSSSERDDEDVLQSSSSSEGAPLVTTSRRHSNAGSSTGAGTKARAQVQAERRRKPAQSTKSNSRPQLKTSASKPSQPSSSKAPPTAPKSMHTVSAAVQPSTAPGVRKVTTISREPLPSARRGRGPLARPNMQAGNISGSFVGIGTKGKQAERAGEVIALGRKSTTPNTNAPTSLYAGMSMRRNSQPSNITAGDAATGANDHEPTISSPIEISPTEPGPPPIASVVDDFIAGIAAEISHPNSPVSSPANSLFDGSYNGDEEVAQLPNDFSHMDVDIYVPGFDDDPPPPPPVTIQPRPQPPATKPTRPTISTEPNATRGFIDGPISARGPVSSDHSFGISPVAASIPLPLPHLPQPKSWLWSGELYLTTSEADPDNENATKSVASRACEVAIGDTVIANEQITKIFKGILTTYIKDKMTISSVMDVNLSFAAIASGALSLYQAAWMRCTDPVGSPEWQLWDGLIHKMEVYFWVAEIRITGSTGSEASQRLLLVPTRLMRKYRNAEGFAKICQHFGDLTHTHTPSFVILMLKKEIGALSDDDEPPAMQVSQLPKYWQQIPPEMKPSFKGVNCLVFPSEQFHHDYEVRLMREQLRQCGAHVLEGEDPKSDAGAVFIHRRYIEDMSRLLGVALRKTKYRVRFYVYGSGGNWRTADWELKEIWKWGGMVTFTPSALIEDPWAVKKVVEALEGEPFWETYIEPKTVGILSLNARKNNLSELSWALDALMIELVTSTETAFYNLALTAPPKWGLLEEYEWARVQVERTMIKDEEELRKSCEDEILEEYKEAMKPVVDEQEEARKAKEEAKKKEEAKQREKENTTVGWGNSSGWGGGDGADNNSWGGGSTDNPWGTNNDGGNNPWAANGSGGGNSWGNGGETNNDPWGADNNSATTTTATAATAKPAELDLSKMGDDNHIRSMSNEVIEGLKWFQIQPCFMLETRRFIVIDSSSRIGIRKPERLEVEVLTADKFVKLIKGEGLW
ncbi:chromo domain protein, partial [Rhizoctonia solani AG-3 Rhs1AP]